MTTKTRVLVTGGAGFIGSHYVRQLLSGGYPDFDVGSVIVLDLMTYAGNEANLAPVSTDGRLRLVTGDVRDAALLADLLPDTDVVVHFAAESHVDRSIAGADDFMSTNAMGTYTLLQVCREQNVHRIVQVSTDEVYGSIATGSWDENCPLEPNSPYSASKASADLIARAFHRTHGLPVCVTRCSNNYGPYQYPEKVIPLFVTELLLGRTVPLYGEGGNVRDWLHVDDHCRAIQLVVQAGRPGEVYNIGGGTELTNLDLTARLLKELGADWSRVRHVPDRRYSVNWSKIRTELGYRPRVDLATGLTETVAWFMENRAWWEPLRALTNRPREKSGGRANA